MTTQSTERTDVTVANEHGETDQSTPEIGGLSMVTKAARNGTVLSIIGGGILALAARNARGHRLRAGTMALVGTALLGLGVRRRRSGDESSSAEHEPGSEREGLESADVGTDEGSAEASAHQEQSKVLHQSETNPRGTSGEPDIDAETDPDAGEVQFTTDQEGDDVEPKPHLEGHEDDPEDPRYADEDDPETADDHVEVDLSEAAMADEASEAVAPDDEQAYPASEGTDPEPTSEKAPERIGEGGVANTGTESDEEESHADIDDEEGMDNQTGEVDESDQSAETELGDETESAEHSSTRDDDETT